MAPKSIQKLVNLLLIFCFVFQNADNNTPQKKKEKNVQKQTNKQKYSK